MLFDMARGQGKDQQLDRAGARKAIPELLQKFYHGTTTSAYEQIKSKGLNNPFLTTDPRLAGYYAEVTADESESEPLILEIDGIDLNPDVLEIDKPALEEPLSTYNDLSDEQLWEQAEELCEQKGLGAWSDLDWKASLELTSSVIHRGDIASGSCRVVE